MPPLLTPLADWVRSRPILRRAAHAAVRLIPDRPHTVRMDGLGPLRIRMRRHRGFLWSNVLKHEGFALGTYKRLIRPGDVVFDVGANIGLFARIMHQWFGAATVIAFEPMRENYELLLTNIELGGLQHAIVPHAVALSDAEGREELQVDDMSSGSAVLSSVSGGKASVGRQMFGLDPLTEVVQVARLDDLVSSQRLPTPNVIKIDTEGAEVKVLRGASGTIDRHSPRLAVALHGLEPARGTLSLLTDLRYYCYGYVVDPESRTGGTAWRRLAPVDADILSNNNIVASRDPDDVRVEIEPLVR